MTRLYPLWRDLMDERQVAALDPGVPDRLPRTPDVLVVGGGMVGMATALACRRAGLGTVVLVERFQLGAGASSGAAGLLVEAHPTRDAAGVVDLSRTGQALWRDLDDLVPGGVGLVDIDWLGLDPDPRLLADLPPEAEVLSAAEVSRMVPALARPVAGVLMRGQARLNPLAALAQLAGGMSDVATTVGVAGVETSGGRVVRVSTTAGSVSPGAVVFATGGPPEVEGLALSVPASLVKGHLIATEPAAPIHLPAAVEPLMTQVDDGRLLAGGTLDRGDDSPEVDDAVVESIRAELAAAIPVVAQLPVSHAWCCFRPVHPDELPVMDRLPTLTNAWMTSGHFRTGIQMAPATGQALARWIESGSPPEEVGGLELARFG